jgi:excinuclease UvrABC nuclease subunit
VKAIKEAPIEELSKVDGISKSLAEQIKSAI